jgi:hypothetical protein
MLPPDDRMKFSRSKPQPHERQKNRRALLAALIVGLIFAAVVGYLLYKHGTGHSS